ncbi:alpha/beta fold hydrolase [Streptomyces sp. NBC_00250]|uniref:alpha/beta fold hydrolase n=1 Tax=Streptomyces sp. NBC_00250 TaxID=2903641 RepID=UPI002E2C30AB|nr:alpha/beta fold hydrolase [Streptomyces sp. NBC_00250]
MILPWTVHPWEYLVNTTPTRRRRTLALALAVLGATSLAACSVGSGPDGGRPRSSTGPADPADRPDLRRFYAQKLAWKPCGDHRCAALTVPMDYSRPADGKTFVLPVAKAVTAVPGKRVGSVVLNPGGPGERGVRLIRDGGADGIGRAVRERFDVVSFDPRGVGESRPALTCTPPGPSETAAEDSTDAPAAVPLHPRTETERADALAAARATAADCRKAGGPLLAHVGTDDAARDLDVLRAALGERRLTYVGWSYGTSLGTSYAEQFPRRVRAMVLDGAVDPSLDWRQRMLGQAAGFRKAAEEYAETCADAVGDACPGETPEDIRALIDRLVERTQREPLPVDDSESGLDAAAVVSALDLSMYTPEAQWEALSEALSAADAGDGTKLAALAAGEEEPGDGEAGTDAEPEEPEPTGTDADKTGAEDDADKADETEPSGTVPEDNSEAALIAINCLDVPHPRDAQAYWDALAPAEKAAGVHGTTAVTNELVCRDWPAGPQRPHRVRAAGVPPVLVVGTAGDPATPYGEAVSLARQFPGGMLLSFDAPGHTGYGRSPCVDKKVEEYLISLAKVRPGTTCPA